MSADAAAAPVVLGVEAAAAAASRHLPWWRDKDALRFVAMLLLTAAFMCAEFAVGILIGSLALQADAYHQAADVLAMAFGMYIVRVVRNGPSDSATYGLIRFEVVGALISAVFLLATCFTIVLEALQRFTEGDALLSTLVPGIDSLLIVAGAGLCMNLFGLLLFGGHSHGGGGHGHSHGGGHGHAHGGGDSAGADASADASADAHSHRHGSSCCGCLRRGGNMNIQSAFLHVLGDAVNNLGVLVAGLLIKYLPYPQRVLADPIASLLIVVVIVAGTWPLVRRSVAMLLQMVPSTVDAVALRAALLGVPGVVSIHDLHIWQLNDSKILCSVHVTVDERVATFASVIDAAKVILHRAGIHSSAVQPETISDDVHRFLLSPAPQVAAPAAAGASPPPRAGAAVTAAAAGSRALPADAQDVCAEFVCGDDCTAASCCPEPVVGLRAGGAGDAQA